MSTPPVTGKPNFDVSCQKIAKVSCKTFHRKTYLTKFFDFVYNLLLKLSDETDFYFEIGSDPLILHFLTTLEFQKTYWLFHLIFRDIQLQQRPKYDIFQKVIFCTVCVKYKFETKRCSSCTVQYLWNVLLFSTKNWSFLKFQCIFKELKIITKLKHSQICSIFSITSLHHKWNGTRLLSWESEFMSSWTSCRTITKNQL